MNFKTTLLLAVVLLVLVVGYIIGSREPGAAPVSGGDEAKLVNIAAADVKKISITPAGGETTVLEREDDQWRITSPISARAEKWTTEDLANTLTGLASRGETEVRDSDRAALGLDEPTKVELTSKDGQTTQLAFGTRSAVGDSTYVQMGDAGKAKVVPADVLDKLEDPLKKYRDMRLTDLNSSDVKQVVVTRPEGALKMHKDGESWVMTEPQRMPLETFAASDIVSSVVNLRASEFVAEDAANVAQYGLTQAKYVVQLSTDAPATQPTTAPAATTVVRLGSYDDIRRQNVYAMAGDAGPVAKVGASVLTTLSKKPLDMRSKDVVTIEPGTVQSIAVHTDIPATTQPTTREASTSDITIVRNPSAGLQGPPAPTADASEPATTQTAAEPPATWLIEGADTPAEEQKVNDLLEKLKPLRATKYLESMPEGAAEATYRLAITQVAAGGRTDRHELTILDRGTSTPIAQTDGLTFEIARDVLDKVRNLANSR